jgi:xanthine/CO dehydrogenase XdhC/CoxF family maturation factor
MAPEADLIRSDAPAGLAESAPENAAHVVMTHSHALDSVIAGAVLERGRFRYLGIIGSRTKRNSFRRAFREIGIAPEMIARVVCPIGGSRVKDKRPEVIAALAAAEIATALLAGD